MSDDLYIKNKPSYHFNRGRRKGRAEERAACIKQLQQLESFFLSKVEEGLPQDAQDKILCRASAVAHCIAILREPEDE